MSEPARLSPRLTDRADALEQAERRWLEASDARIRAARHTLDARGHAVEREMRDLERALARFNEVEQELLALTRSFLIAWREEKDAHARAEAKAQEVARGG